MKKFCLLLLSLVLLIALSAPAMAAEVDLSVSASKTTVQAGDEVVITISSAGTTPYTSLGGDIKYDKSVFEFVSRKWGPAVNDNDAYLRSYDSDSATFSIGWEHAGAYSDKVLEITLKVIGTKPGNATISFGDLACNNSDTNSSVSIAGSSVQIALICEHSYSGDWIKVDDNTHKRVCSKCDTPDVQNHEWDTTEVISPAYCTQPGEKKVTCSKCKTSKNEPIPETGHAWDNGCDAVCNNDSSHTRETSHTYDGWTCGEIYHWHTCTECKVTVDSAEHVPGPEATEEAAQVCTVCNAELAPQLEHVHDKSSEWFNDGDNHWHMCLQMEPSCKEKLDLAAHDYDDACDVSCNTCGYTRVAPHDYKPELQAGLNGHWQVCAICNTHSETTAHIPGAEATDDTPQTCTECGFILKMQLSHVHDFGELWYSDNTDHWQSCNDAQCPEVASKEAHAWDEGEELAEGGIRYTCSICAKQLTLSEPMGTEPETTPSTAAPTQPATPKPTKPEVKDAITWEWAGIAAIVLLLIGLILLIIEFVRSRKTNMHGKFSK